jgi:hypothetical protein
MCRSSSEKPKNKSVEKSKKVFNDFHNKRTQTFKLNSNDLVKVSQNELNEVNAFLKELDVFHREQFDELKKQLKTSMDTFSSKDEKKEDNEVSETVVEIVAEEENIFLKKD